HVCLRRSPSDPQVLWHRLEDGLHGRPACHDRCRVRPRLGQRVPCCQGRDRRGARRRPRGPAGLHARQPRHLLPRPDAHGHV
ncbi:hypothetical protein APUTEX25_000921, partial [Auxenochlorella protothecoides]